MIYDTTDPLFRGFLGNGNGTETSAAEFLQSLTEEEKKRGGSKGQVNAKGAAADGMAVNTGGDRGGNGRGSHTTGSAACR